MNTLGKILSITEVNNLKLTNVGSLNGNNGSRLGVTQMLNAICGYGGYDGYKITTDKHTFLILIDNCQSCCENWGYFYLNDDVQMFIGAKLREVNLTNMALNKQKVEESGYYGGGDGDDIQFVDFVTTKGVLQVAVYNEHNGYYGHSIIFAKDEDIFHSDTL